MLFLRIEAKSFVIVLFITLLIGTLCFGLTIFSPLFYTLNISSYERLAFPKLHFLLGIFLLIYTMFTFLREWYHRFKRGTTVLFGLVVSLLLLLNLVLTYLGFNRFISNIPSPKDLRPIGDGLKPSLSILFLHNIQKGLIATSIFAVLCVNVFIWAIVSQMRGIK